MARKSIYPRKLSRLWTELTNNEGYIIPETIEDFKLLGPFTFFKHNGYHVYLKPETRKTWYEFGNEIKNFMGSDLYSITTINKATQREITNHLTGKDLNCFENHMAMIIASIEAENKKRFYIQAISGLEVQDTFDKRVGSWGLTKFSENNINEIVSCMVGSDNWKATVTTFLTKEYLGRCCLIVEAVGDHEQSRIRAQQMMQYIVNTLRYAICVHFADSGLAHNVRIELSAIASKYSSNFFCYNLEEGSVLINKGSSSFRQPYRLTTENLNIIISDWNLNELWSLVLKPDLTDVEHAIIEAVTWIGDAQMDSDSHMSFIKYWTALESMITGYEGGRETDRLKKSIPILLNEIGCDVPSKNKVNRLYERRSNTLHGRGKPITAKSELNEVCQWAYRIVAVYLNLRSRGYTSRKQIFEQTERLNNIKKSSRASK